MNELGPHDTPVKDVAQVSFSHRQKEKPGFVSRPRLEASVCPSFYSCEYLRLLLLLSGH